MNIDSTPNYIFDEKNFLENYNVYRGKYLFSEIAAVLKSNAYGVGNLKRLVSILKVAGCKIFYVGTLDEALAVKKTSPKSSVYVLYTKLSSRVLKIFLQEDLIFVIKSAGEILEIDNFLKSETNKDFCEFKKIKVAIKIDSGLSRLGLNKNDLEEVYEIFKKNQSFLKVESIFSHLACSGENVIDNKVQLEEFNFLSEKYFPKVKKSISASNVLLRGESFEFEQDIIRVGSGLYGLVYDTVAKELGLQFPLKIKARILRFFDVEKGDKVGYGGSFIAKKKMKLATVQVGYSDGLPLRNRGVYFLYDGLESKKAYKLNVVGVISMNLTTIDISSVPFKEFKKNNFVYVISDKEHFNNIVKASKSSPLELFCKLGLGINNKVFKKK